jgi:hypothetical protein
MKIGNFLGRNSSLCLSLSNKLFKNKNRVVILGKWPSAISKDACCKFLGNLVMMR